MSYAPPYGNTGEASKSGHSLAVTTSGSGTGRVDLSPPGGAYDEGTTVTLTAVTSPGSFFVGWVGDMTGSANPETILMDDHKSVVAHFIYPQLTVLSAPIVDVAITGTRSGTTPYTADCDLHEVVSLTAPESVSVGGKTYYFELWFVDNVSVLPSEGCPFNEVEVTMDDGRTAVAQYGWRLPAIASRPPGDVGGSSIRCAAPAGPELFGAGVHGLTPVARRLAPPAGACSGIVLVVVLVVDPASSAGSWDVPLLARRARGCSHGFQSVAVGSRGQAIRSRSRSALPLPSGMYGGAAGLCLCGRRARPPRWGLRRSRKHRRDACATFRRS